MAAVLPQTAKITPQSFVNADSTTKKTLYTAGSSGSKIVALNATSTDTSARTIQIWLTRSAVSYLLGTVVIPIAAGTDGTNPSVNLLPSWLMAALPIDNDGQRYLLLENGDTLQASMTVAVTSAKEIDVATIGANF